MAGIARSLGALDRQHRVQIDILNREERTESRLMRVREAPTLPTSLNEEPVETVVVMSSKNLSISEHLGDAVFKNQGQSK